MKVLASSEGSGYSPSIWFLVAVIKGLQPLLFLLFAEACGIRDFEESWRKFYKPPRVNGGHLPHVLLGGQHKLMIHHPFWLAIEQCAGGVDVDHLLVYEGSVTFLRVLFGCVSEETTADGLLYTYCGFTA